MNAWRTDSTPRRRPSFRDCHGACVVGKVEAVPDVDVGFLFVPSDTPDGKGNTTVTGDSQLQVILIVFCAGGAGSVETWKWQAGIRRRILLAPWTELTRMSDRSERAFFVAGTSTNAHHTSGRFIHCKRVWTDRSAGRGVVFFCFANIVMFWNASLRTVTHFRRCSQTSLLCTRRHANRSLTAERLRGAELIGGWKRAVAHDVEVTTLTECYVYGSVLGNGWLRGEGRVGSEVRNVLRKPESTRHCSCLLHCHFFSRRTSKEGPLIFLSSSATLPPATCVSICSRVFNIPFVVFVSMSSS